MDVLLVLIENCPLLGKNLLHTYYLRSFSHLGQINARKSLPFFSQVSHLWNRVHFQCCKDTVIDLHRVSTQWPADTGPAVERGFPGPWTSITRADVLDYVLNWAAMTAKPRAQRWSCTKSLLTICDLFCVFHVSCKCVIIFS